MTGDLNPDARGDYEDAGELNGKRHYARTPNSFFIWWDGVNSWILGTALGIPGPNHWKRTDPAIEGEYSPQGSFSGTPTVTEI